MTAEDGRFPLTRHSVLAAVQSDDGATRQLAWDALVRAYWKPVYKYLRLRWHLDAEAARDGTQEFFARAMEKGFFEAFDPARARFRTFLRVCVDGFAAKEREAQGRLKRGGGVSTLSLDFESALDFETAEGELVGIDPPAEDRFDECFHQEWMRSLFELALADLRTACIAEGRELQYEAFRLYDIEGPEHGRKLQYADLARELDVPVTQVTNWLHAIRARLRTLVLGAIEGAVRHRRGVPLGGALALRSRSAVSSEVPTPAGRPIGDAVLAHLRSVVDQPDVSGTRYDLIEPVGRGGMGTVYRAHDRQLVRDVALKVLAEPDADAARQLAARIVAEARALARLEHPGIVPVHDVGLLADGRAFYAMKLVVGRRLDELLRAGIDEHERFRIFARICEAVAFAHARGVLHLDLKPMNIMVGQFGEVLVLDWGLSQVTHPAQNAGGVRAGTVGFMAPEQHEGRTTDARTDVFALGRVLTELDLHGREGTAIVQKATAASPADRYASVAELAQDVARFQAGERLEAVPESIGIKLRRFYRKYRAAVWLVGTYAVLRIGFEVVRAWMRSRNP